MKTSVGEATFQFHCRAYNLEPEAEFRFHPERKWRFDFCFPDQKLAVEVEGGTWINGRHNRASSIEKDMEKYSQAALLGWRVLRFTTAQVKSGMAIDVVREALCKSST